MEPFTEVFPGRLVSHLEALSPAVAAAATDFLQHWKKTSPAQMHKVHRVSMWWWWWGGVMPVPLLQLFAIDRTALPWKKIQST